MPESVPEPNRLDLTDWPDVGTSVLRALLAEGVVAELAERTAPGAASWKGGQTRGADVVADDKRYDAKSVRLDGDEVVLTRRDAEPYDDAKVDHLVLVHLAEARSGFAIDLAAGLARIQGAARIQDVWMLTVQEINALMPKHGADDRTWRNVHLPLGELEPFRVLLD